MKTSAIQSMSTVRVSVVCERLWHVLQAQTKVKLGATAGLRLLPDGKADAILAAVKSYLAKSPFELDQKTGVTILDGIVTPP